MSETQHEIAAIKKVTLAPAVRRHIERMILTGAFPIGRKINEVALARELEVSRGPVREACSQLAASGFLTNIPQRGCFVREVSFEEAMEVYEVRIALADSVASLAAERASKRQRNALAKLPEKMEQANTSGDTEAINELSEAFHRLLAECTGNKTLIQTLASLHVTHRLFRLRVLEELGDLKSWLVKHNRVSIEERKLVIDAVVAGDAEEAARLFGQYAQAIRDRSYARYSDARDAQKRSAG